MTNIDLEHIYTLLSYIRYKPERQANIQCLDELILALQTYTVGTFITKEVNERIKSCMRLEFWAESHCFEFIKEPYNERDIEDINVYTFFKKYFLGLKYLCEDERYSQVFWLIDYLDNFPKYIYDNDLILPFDKLKSCLKPYWRKYDKNFLKDFIKNR